MEEVQEPVQDMLPMNTSPEPVSQHCLAHSDLLPEITPPPQNNSTGTSPNSTPRPKNLFTEPPATDDTVLVDGILPTNSCNTTTNHVENLAEINPLPDLAESQRQQENMQCICNIDNPLNINTLSDCVTNHEKQRANPSVGKEISVNDHTLSDRVTNRSTQSSSESNNFVNNLDQQETKNENTSLDTSQTLANGSNIYLVKQMKKHRHQIKKLKFLIKWLDYLNHPNTWKPEDHLPPVLVQKCFQQSPLESPTPTNAVLPISDVYRPCQLLLNKKVFWMLILTLITVIILTAVASRTHCHSKPPFGKQDKSFVSPGHNLTWKKLLAYGTSIRFTVWSLLVESKKNSRLYFLPWTLPPVLAKRLHIFNHLVLGDYDPISPKNTSLIQRVTHARCHLAMEASESPCLLKDPNTTP